MRLLKENAILNNLSKLNKLNESAYVDETDMLKRLYNVYLMDRVIRGMNDEGALYDSGWLYEVADESTDNGFEEFKKDAEVWDYAKGVGKGTYYYTSDEDYKNLCNMYKEILDIYGKDGFITREYYSNRDGNYKELAGLDAEQIAFLKQDIPNPKLFGKEEVPDLFKKEDINESVDEEDDSNKPINPEDRDYNDGRLWKVCLWSGSGYSLYEIYVYARYEEDALNQVVAYCERESMSGLIYTEEEIEKMAEEDYADEFKNFKQERPDVDLFDFITEYLDYFYVDATMEGASQPYFIHGENLRIEEVSEDEVLKMNESVKRKDPEEGFEIDDDLANSCDMTYKGIKSHYIWDTNTLVFSYDNDKYRDIDLDTIIYRNQTPEEIKEYIDTQLLPYIKNKDNIKESVTTSEPKKAIDAGATKKTSKKVKDYLNYELQDDDTETGGISFNGETVEDFIGDTDIDQEEDIDVLNKALVSCGIKPIVVESYTEEDGLGMIADEIHKEFKNSEDKSKDTLKSICDKHNITVNDYLYVDGYNSFEELIDELKESEEPEREWLKDKDTYNRYKKYVDKQLRDGAIDDPEYVNTLSDKEYDDLLTLTWMKDKDMLDMFEERLKESEETAYITNYLINGGEYAISICEKGVGGDCDFLVKAKDGKGNSSEISGYDQIEGFEFTEEDEPFYSEGAISDEDVINLVHKFKPDLEVKDVSRLLKLSNTYTEIDVPKGSISATPSIAKEVNSKRPNKVVSGKVKD